MTWLVTAAAANDDEEFTLPVNPRMPGAVTEPLLTQFDPSSEYFVICPLAPGATGLVSSVTYRVSGAEPAMPVFRCAKKKALTWLPVIGMPGRLVIVLGPEVGIPLPTVATEKPLDWLET